VTEGYSLTRLTSILAALTASPGAATKFAKEGLLGEALLALAGMLAVLPGKLTPPPPTYPAPWAHPTSMSFPPKPLLVSSC